MLKFALKTGEFLSSAIILEKMFQSSDGRIFAEDLCNVGGIVCVEWRV